MCGGEFICASHRRTARLAGEVRVMGAKNSALKLMAFSLLAPGKNTLYNVPQNADVEIMSDLLSRLGCEITFDHTTGTMVIDVLKCQDIKRSTN